MKRYVKTQSILAEVNPAPDPGTVIYKIRLADLYDAWNQAADVNVWLEWAIKEFGFDAFDFEVKLPGTYKQSNTLYILKTDNKPILVDGVEIDPLDIIQAGELDALASYIETPTMEQIRKLLTPYELAHLTNVAYHMGYKTICKTWDAKRVNEDWKALQETYKN